MDLASALTVAICHVSASRTVTVNSAFHLTLIGSQCTRATCRRTVGHLMLACGVVLLVAGCDTRTTATNRQASAQFEAIRADVLRGEYETTTIRLAKFMDAHPNHPDASRAGLFIGKCFLARGDLPAARQAFQTTVDTYPGTLEDHKCRYKLAVVSMLEGDHEEAIRQFDEIANNPDGPLACEATAMAKYLREQAN